jgi:hypothetical protein
VLGGAVYKAQKAEAELELPTKALKQLSLLQGGIADETVSNSPRKESTLSRKDLETIFKMQGEKEVSGWRKLFLQSGNSRTLV